MAAPDRVDAVRVVVAGPRRAAAAAAAAAEGLVRRQPLGELRRAAAGGIRGGRRSGDPVM